MCLFHVSRVNSGKITTLNESTLFGALVRWESLHQVERDFVTLSLFGSNTEDFVILACTVLIKSQGMTDRRTLLRWLIRA